MSVVERALKKLQSRAAAGSPRAAPIARVTVATADAGVGPATDLEAPLGPPSRSVEIDFEAMRLAGLYAAGNDQLADEYRMIKQPLLRKATGQAVPGETRNNLIMVTSSLAAEGKTFTSLNLSLSLASEKDWRVLLVDCDCKNPQLTRLIGASAEPGLLDWLGDPSPNLQSMVMATNVHGLSVLPLGARDAHSVELLGSAQMSSLCAAWAADPRQIVVFDSSPVLLTVESSVLSHHIGQIVVVVDASHTPQQAVFQTIEKLDSSKAIGLLLNRADQSGDGFGYGYGYGSYGDAGQPTPSAQ